MWSAVGEEMLPPNRLGFGSSSVFPPQRCFMITAQSDVRDYQIDTGPSDGPRVLKEPVLYQACHYFDVCGWGETSKGEG